MGIVTPEIDEPENHLATVLSQDLVDRRQATLIQDASVKDQYGRLLRNILVDDVFINYELVR